VAKCQTAVTPIVSSCWVRIAMWNTISAGTEGDESIDDIFQNILKDVLTSDIGSKKKQQACNARINIDKTLENAAKQAILACMLDLVPYLHFQQLCVAEIWI